MFFQKKTKIVYKKSEFKIKNKMKIKIIIKVKAIQITIQV